MCHRLCCPSISKAYEREISYSPLKTLSVTTVVTSSKPSFVETGSEVLTYDNFWSGTPRTNIQRIHKHLKFSFSMGKAHCRIPSRLLTYLIGTSLQWKPPLHVYSAIQCNSQSRCTFDMAIDKWLRQKCNRENIEMANFTQTITIQSTQIIPLNVHYK